VGERRFFRNILPLRPLSDLREEVFGLVYHVPGLSYRDVVTMPSEEREWLCVRLVRQLKSEKDSWKKAFSKKR
jgi:hypothetical protein